MTARNAAKVAMARRVLEFCRANPHPLRRHIEAVSRLENLLAQVDVLSFQRNTGSLLRRQSTQERAALRRIIRDRYLRHLVRISRADLSGRLSDVFTLPDKNDSADTFLASVVAMTESARREWEVFIQSGLSQGFLDELDGLIEKFRATATRETEGIKLQAGARIDLAELLTTRLMLVVRQLDAINLLRFEDQPGKRGDWLAARSIVWTGCDSKGKLKSDSAAA
jgi:hypothetical protein